MSRAVFLDRDGTINKDFGYVSKIQDLEFERNAVEGIRMFQDLGYRLIIITNQSGIARGIHTEEQTQRFNDELVRRLGAEDIKIDGVYYCPHFPGGKVTEYAIECGCRKPKIGMISKALEQYPDIELEKSVMIGDKVQDVETGKSAGCITILVNTGKGGGDGQAKPDYVAADLKDAAEWVASLR